MNVILSIHPELAKLIYEGKKTLELRKNIPMNTVNIVYLYETAPICKVTGFFKYLLHKDIITEKSCVPVEEIKNYFGKSEEIFGWICNAGHKGNQFAYPVELSEFGIKRPPQSWCYTKVTSNAKTVEYFELERLHKLSDVISERWGFKVNM